MIFVFSVCVLEFAASSCRLKAFPANISQLSNLKRLDFHDNLLTELPAGTKPKKRTKKNRKSQQNYSKFFEISQICRR